MVKDLKEVIELPDSVQVALEGHSVIVRGPKGEIIKKLVDPMVNLIISGKEVIVDFNKKIKQNKKSKMILNTFKAHLKTMIRGVIEGYEYKLKICSGHFPMSVNIEGNKIVIKNFLGERVPRKAEIMKGVKAEIKGDIIILQGIDKEIVGTCAGRIELATKISNRDRRVFQDGIFLIEKAGKNL